VKVLIVYHGGAHASARSIFEKLCGASRIELVVIAPEKFKVERVFAPHGLLCVEKEENRDGYRLVPVPLRDPSKHWQGFEGQRLGSVIKQVKPDIIHVLDEPTSYYLYQVVWGRLRAYPVSKVLFYAFENRPFRLGLRSGLKWRLTWAQMAGGAAANQESLENVRRAGFPRRRTLERICWGIATDIFKPMDRCLLRKSFGLDCEYIVGFVGRFVPEKGLAVLLAAMLRLPSSVHCMIIGDGPMRAELELWSRLPDLYGRIHLYDVMAPETLAMHMNCMDVLVLPSVTVPHWKEQYGRVIGEAMACGVPVVGSDSGAIPEVVGSAGLIVPEQDASALADAVRTTLFNDSVRESLKQKGLNRAERELSITAMTGQLLGFYSRILEA
jgi:glycosyltransferase involved in cell wall biosynthesis